MTLPILLSVPHAGLEIPPEAKAYCCLTREQIAKDGDEGAAEIYDLRDQVAAFASTSIARAIVDQNRARSDRRTDGVVKTHTCWNEPVYHSFPPEEVIDRLLDQYYEPYHQQLRSQFSAEVRLGVDCHTMAAVGPPIGPDTGSSRPVVCLGDNHGATLPAGWMDQLAACFRQVFEKKTDVTVNQPFSGGYITQTHGKQHPWVQLELTRDPKLSTRQKRARVLAALTLFCEKTFSET
jgi:formiminoglutamase